MNPDRYLVLTVDKLVGDRYTVSRVPSGTECNTPTETIVIDLTMNPPRVVAAYMNCNYRCFANELPEQFIDHRGTLRTSTGRAALIGARDMNNSYEDDSNATPWVRVPERGHRLGDWMAAQPQQTASLSEAEFNALVKTVWENPKS